MAQDVDKIINSYKERFWNLNDEFRKLEPKLEETLSKDNCKAVRKKFEGFHSKIYSIIAIGISLTPFFNEAGTIDSKAIKDAEEALKNYETFIKSLKNHILVKNKNKTPPQKTL